MPVVGLLPLWVLLYAWALKPTERVVAGPLGEGKTVFATCASCHGSTGGGGVGRQLSNGEVLKTFPKFEDQASLVYTGSAPYSGKIYGDPNRPGGPHQGGSFNGASCPSRAPSSAGPSRTRRSSPSSATSASRSPAPTRSTRSTCRSSPTGARRTRRSPRGGQRRRQDARRRGHQHDAQGLSEPVPSTRSYEVLVVGGGPAGARPRTGSPATATTSPSSSARRSRARRPAATA